MEKSNSSHTIIIGASAAGLSCAVCLKQLGIPFIVLEKSDSIGNEWENRYDRLHLHTTKTHSQLPYYKMPAQLPKYVSKKDFADYLKNYASTFNIHPEFNQKVLQAEQKENWWEVSTGSEKFQSQNMIIATGHAAIPNQVYWKGMERFKGEIIHSSRYKNGKSYKSKNVLVVGFGNSACEIALCLHEHQATPSLSVRNGVNLLPRDIFGVSIVNIAIAEKWLTKISPALADAVNKPVLRLVHGELGKYGLKHATYGPMTQIMKYKKIPLLDIGTIRLIKESKIKVFPGIDHITENGVVFTDGREVNFEVIILATGYQPAFKEFLKEGEKVFDESGIQLTTGKESAFAGLYFCGFNVSATGMLREIAIEAKQLAYALKKR